MIKAICRSIIFVFLKGTNLKTVKIPKAFKVSTMVSLQGYENESMLQLEIIWIRFVRIHFRLEFSVAAGSYYVASVKISLEIHWTD